MDFTLTGQTPQEIEREATEAKERTEAKAQREEIARRLAAPLRGDSSDVGQGVLFDGDENLFSGTAQARKGCPMK